MKRLSQILLEDIIGKVAQKINVVFQLDKTKHAGERQSRHDDRYITDTEMKMAAEKALPMLSKYLLFNRLDVGDHVLIHDKRSDLNMVGVLQESHGMLELRIITVMVKKNFKPKPGTKTVEI